MLIQKTNFHHSKLPDIGAIGNVVIRRDRWNKPELFMNSRTKWQVVAYNLNDNIGPYSVGQHLVWVKSLRSGFETTIACQYFEEVI